jgi:hypothetical protein
MLILQYCAAYPDGDGGIGRLEAIRVSFHEGLESRSEFDLDGIGDAVMLMDKCLINRRLWTFWSEI